MGKSLMLFVWFLKFGIFRPMDEYGVHDYIKERFCPEYIAEKEFDEKEQFLRDTPGPAGIKYAYYVGNKVGGFLGAVAAVSALILPVVAVGIGIFFAYQFITGVQNLNNSKGESVIFNAMNAAALGLVLAHLYKIIYFNEVKKKSFVFILPSAAIFIFVTAILRDREIEINVMPYYIIAVIALGLIFGVIHVVYQKYREKHPKIIDPYGKKAKKLRDRQIREEEEQMRGYIDDDSIKRRREQLEEESKKAKKHKGEE